jgi:hypothetical protein
LSKREAEKLEKFEREISKEKESEAKEELRKKKEVEAKETPIKPADLPTPSAEKSKNGKKGPSAPPPIAQPIAETTAAPSQPTPEGGAVPLPKLPAE